MDGCGFETLPKEVWEVPGRVQSLMELNLTNNRLKDLPHVSTRKYTGRREVADTLSELLSRDLNEACVQSVRHSCVGHCVPSVL